jgi:hypothetical protein
MVIVFVILVTLSAVLGAVLGTTLGHHDAAAVANITITPNTKPPNGTASLSGIRPNSALAVTGWRNGNNFSIRIFYHGADDNLRVSSFESDVSKWSAPNIFAKAKPGTPVGASSFNSVANGIANNAGVGLDVSLQTELMIVRLTR